MILDDEIKIAAKKFVVEHSPNFTERDVALIEIAMRIGANLGLQKASKSSDNLRDDVFRRSEPGNSND